MKNLQNFHIILVSVLSLTESKPLRIKVQSDRFKHSVIIPFNNEAGSGAPALESAQNCLESKGFNLIGKGESAARGCYYIITDTFEPLKLQR